GQGYPGGYAFGKSPTPFPRATVLLNAASLGRALIVGRLCWLGRSLPSRRSGYGVPAWVPA
ncbi:MAG: hypothetical protein ACO3YU_10695, partial [Candidatus Nanopelagicales bacterium]